MDRKQWLPVTALALVAILSGCGSTASSTSGSESSGNQNPNSKWVSSDSADKTVILKLEAAYNNANGGMSFDGYANGDMTVTIPKGWKVQVTFSNDSAMPHSAMVVAYEYHQKYSFNASSVIFNGASTPNPSSGSLKGTTENFDFTADKAGKYSVVCAVPGHAATGMWDTLIVSNAARNASILTK